MFSRLAQNGCFISTLLLLSACGNTSPTAPSTLDSGRRESTTAVIASPSTGASTQSVTTQSGPAPAPSAANYEIKFMENMIDHHAMAVAMGQLCLEKAVHEELRALCQSIISSQSAEIAQMQSWLQAWYGISYQPEMKPGDQHMMDRLAALSDAEFEIAFMEMMIKHHEKAIKEGRMCLDKAYHAELRALCENIVTTQSAEIAQMQTWLCQWYECGKNPAM
jgi:uncharacterized protein (DUF305 family)